MPRIKTFVCSGICVLYVTALTAQVLPKNSSMQQIVGYHFYQQKKWSMQQLPKNSVLYLFNSKHIIPGDKFSATNVHLPQINISPAPVSYKYSFSSGSLGELQSYLHATRFQYYKWQKESFWRDPSKGIGAELLKGVLSKSNNFIQ